MGPNSDTASVVSPSSPLLSLSSPVSYWFLRFLDSYFATRTLGFCCQRGSGREKADADGVNAMRVSLVGEDSHVSLSKAVTLPPGGRQLGNHLAYAQLMSYESALVPL